jgi:hypothetical protein
MCDCRIGTVIVRRPVRASRISHNQSFVHNNVTLFVHGPRLCEGLVTFQERETVSFETALFQWQNYVDIFRLHGWKIVEMDPADECPDAVFIEVSRVQARFTATPII